MLSLMKFGCLSFHMSLLMIYPCIKFKSNQTISYVVNAGPILIATIYIVCIAGAIDVYGMTQQHHGR